MYYIALRNMHLCAFLRGLFLLIFPTDTSAGTNESLISSNLIKRVPETQIL